MTKWIDEAKKHIGLKEISGKNDHPLLLGWWVKYGVKYLYKKAWCGLFTAHSIKSAGHPIPKHWYRALAWLDWGVDIGSPCYGCVVVFSRTGGGHVGFVVGKDDKGRLMVLGGNQGDSVSIAPFDLSRVAGYRMPIGTFHRGALPTLLSKESSSTNEA
jgi:uncharacterized protein (TIGR02594 family)